MNLGLAHSCLATITALAALNKNNFGHLSCLSRALFNLSMVYALWPTRYGLHTMAYMLTTWFEFCHCVLRGAVAEQTLQQGQRSMHMAAVVVLLVNAEDVRDRGAGVSKRELALASDVIKEGRALLIVANKLDACSEDERSAVSHRLSCCA